MFHNVRLNAVERICRVGEAARRKIFFELPQ
jgi:hypothetical protein